MSSIQQLIQIYAQTNDATYRGQIIDQLKNNPMVWVAYSPITKNLYLDYVKGAPTAFVFSEKSFCDNYKAHLAQSKIAIQTMECDKTARIPIFSDMMRSGVEQVVVDNGKMLLYLDLYEIIKKPDFSVVPEEQRPVMNPSLMKSADWFFQSFASEKQDKNMESLMMRDIYQSKYILPMLNTKVAEQGTVLKEVNIGEGNILQIPALEQPNGQTFIPVFTDWIELKRFDKQGLCMGNVISFKDIELFCQKGERVVINPFGFNMMLDNGVISYIEQTAKQYANTNGEPTVFALDVVQGEFVSELVKVFESNGAVKKAYLTGLRQNGQSGYMIILDIEDGQEGLLPNIPQLVAPLAGNVPITFVKYNTEFGLQAAQNLQPFYEKYTVQ